MSNDSGIAMQSVFIQQFLVTATVFGTVSLVATWYLWSHARPDGLLRYEPRRTVPWTGAELLILVVVALLLQMIVAAAIGSFVNLTAGSEGDRSTAVQTTELLSPTSPWGAALAMTISLATFAAGTLLLRVVSRATWRDMGLSFDHLGRNLALGLIAFVAIATPVYGIQFLLTQFYPSHHPLIELWAQNPSAQSIVMMFLVAVVVAPLSEEFVFRGALQGWLEKEALRWRERLQPPEATTSSGAGEGATERGAAGKPSLASESVEASGEIDEPLAPPLTGWSAAVPILISSVVFAAAHYSHWPDPVALFILALMLGLLYQRTHRLWPSVVVHACLNAVSLLLVVFGPEQQ